MPDLPTHRTILSDKERSTLVQALEKIRKEICWKPGKDIIHLEKRKRMRHLAESATIADYEQLIYDIVNDGRSVVYLYVFRGRHYYAVRGFSKENDEWLVIFGQNGIIETAFPPESPDNYLEHRGFVHLARTVEVLGWTKEVNN